MRTPNFLNDVFDDATGSQLLILLRSVEINFVRLSMLVNLDPSCDFQHANLVGVDFSNCDLRAFDFRGADLSGSYGVNIDLPDREMLEGSRVVDSPFSFVVIRSEIAPPSGMVRKSLEFDESDPTYLSSWIYDSTQLGARGRENAIATAFRILEKTKDPTIASDIVHAASRFFGDSLQFRDFLIWVTSNANLSQHAVRNAYKLLAKVFRNDLSIMRLLVATFSNSQEEWLRRAAYDALSLKSFSAIARDEVKQILFQPSSQNLRLHIIREAIGPTPQRVFYFFDGIGFGQENLIIDFARTVTSEEFSSMAFRVAERNFRTNLFARGVSESKLDEEISKRGGVIVNSEAVNTVLEGFRRLYEAGVTVEHSFE